MIDTISSEKRLNYMDKNLNQKQAIKLKTCADVYGHWRLYKRTYKKAPEDGVEFQIDYIDTGLALDEESRSKAPIALALHGAPGSYHDFALLIQHLSQQKVRVIAPNFPEYIATVKTKVLFRHSADEKAAYLRDFLQAIRVNKIDLLVSHSSAIFPTLLILLNGNDEAIRRRKQLEQQLEQQQQQQLQLKQRPRKQRDWLAHELGANTKTRQQVSSINSNSSSNNNNNNGNDENKVKNNGARYDDDDDDDGGGNCGLQLNGSNRGDLNQANQRRHHQPLVVNYQQPQEMAENNCDDPQDDGGEEHFEDANEYLDRNNNAHKKQQNCNENQNNKQIKSEAKNSSEEGEQLNANTQQVVTMEQTKNTRQNGMEKQTPFSGALELFLSSDNNKQNNCYSAGIQVNREKKKKKKRRTDAVVEFHQPIEIKAVALLNPAGHRLPKSMKPTWFKCGAVHVYQHRFGRSLFRKFGPAFLTVVGVPVRVDNMDNVMLSATVMRNSKCHRVSKQLEQLSQMKIPTLLVFSENDKLIEKEIFHEMTQFMKLDSRNFDTFNDDGNIELSQSSMEDWIRVMVFKAGGHYAYSNYAKTVNQAVSELLEKVRNRPAPSSE